MNVPINVFLEFDIKETYPRHFLGVVDLSTDQESKYYYSLVKLVERGYEFDEALETKAEDFLEYLMSAMNSKPDKARRLVTSLIYSSDESPSDFVQSISTLVSSRYPTITKAKFSFLFATIRISSANTRIRLMELDLDKDLKKADTSINLKEADTPINLRQQLGPLPGIITFGQIKKRKICRI
ncbi:hypothetical protein BLNAU_8861 [Blattamonas nauphoetae]|uniref:Uncharacterized protein n=1 Tax=Blattamonas nauphoetae TaxID=2049346 RepID=A0ABQ9XX82_9EUKA|nr:hypothetical protein BLNAU_8861 [Blattamonas nauphoetae]